MSERYTITLEAKPSRIPAIILLAEVIRDKQLTLNDGEAIAQGIYLGLDRIPEEGKSLSIIVGGGIDVTQNESLREK